MLTDAGSFLGLSLAREEAPLAAFTGTQFTCITGTKVHILPLLLAREEDLLSLSRVSLLSLFALLVQKYKY
jgi:hypothetical protein